MQWNKDSIGNYSIAMGYNTKAAFLSTAFGQATTASGFNSTSFGVGTIASGPYSTAFGEYTIASAGYSTALGSNTKSTGEYSTAIGKSTKASGWYSLAAGFQTKSKSYVGTVVGSYNDTTNAANHINFDAANRLFQIGKGTADNARSNAMTVLQNGNVGIGTTTPSLLFQVAKNTSYGTGNTYGIAATNATNTNLRLNLGYDSTIDAAVIQASQDGTTVNKKLLLNPNAGNVGIGITSPTNLLDVGDRIRIRNGASGTAGIYLTKNDNSTEVGFIGNYNDTYLGMWGGNGAGWNFFMNTANGNVGIGTNTPST